MKPTRAQNGKVYHIEDSCPEYRQIKSGALKGKGGLDICPWCLNRWQNEFYQQLEVVEKAASKKDTSVTREEALPILADAKKIADQIRNIAKKKL